MIRLFVGVLLVVVAAAFTGAAFAVYRVGTRDDRERFRTFIPFASIFAGAGAWLFLNGLDVITE